MSPGHVHDRETAARRSASGDVFIAGGSSLGRSGPRRTFPAAVAGRRTRRATASCWWVGLEADESIDLGVPPRCLRQTGPELAVADPGARARRTIRAIRRWSRWDGGRRSKATSRSDRRRPRRASAGRARRGGRGRGLSRPTSPATTSGSESLAAIPSDPVCTSRSCIRSSSTGRSSRGAGRSSSVSGKSGDSGPRCVRRGFTNIMAAPFRRVQKR